MLDFLNLGIDLIKDNDNMYMHNYIVYLCNIHFLSLSSRSSANAVNPVFSTSPFTCLKVSSSVLLTMSSLTSLSFSSLYEPRIFFKAWIESAVNDSSAKNNQVHN